MPLAAAFQRLPQPVRATLLMLAAMGCQTGIDLEKLFAVREHLADGLPDEPLYGFVTNAGLPLGFTGAAQT